jgi:protein-disulfide isomerase
MRGAAAPLLVGSASATAIGGRFALIGSAAAQGGSTAPRDGAAAPQDGAAAEPEVSREDLMSPGPLPDKMLGSSAAPVTVVEYAAMTCPHCGQFAATTFVELKSRYIDTGKVRLIFREFPLDRLDAIAVMLARSVGDDRYFMVVEALLTRQQEWISTTMQPLMTFATTQLGFTPESFNATIANEQLFDDITKARDRATALGVKAVPSFFINGKKRTGYFSSEKLDGLIGPLLKA